MLNSDNIQIYIYFIEISIIRMANLRKKIIVTVSVLYNRANNYQRMIYSDSILIYICYIEISIIGMANLRKKIIVTVSVL